MEIKRGNMGDAEDTVGNEVREVYAEKKIRVGFAQALGAFCRSELGAAKDGVIGEMGAARSELCIVRGAFGVGEQKADDLGIIEYLVEHVDSDVSVAGKRDARRRGRSGK